MQGRQVRFGEDVYSRDGQRLGSVDHLVLNTDNNHVESLVVKKGFLSGDKLIDIDLIAAAEGDRVVLELPASEAEQLPNFVQTRYTAAPPDVVVDEPLIVPGSAAPGGLLYDAATIGRGFPGSGSSLYEPAPIDPPPVVDRDNLPPQDVMLSEGTDVYGSDGKKVGSVDEVVFDAGGNLDGFVIKQGLIFHHDVRVPMRLVAHAGGDRVTLNVPASGLEHEGARPE
jgi:uncharacterized protein YrrD